MNTLFFEYDGRSARALMSGLPEETPQVRPVQRTSSGEVAGTRVSNGLVPLDAEKLLPQSLIDGDPEINVTRSGEYLEEVSAAWFDPSAASPEPIGDFEILDVVSTPEGEEKERRPHLLRKCNTNVLHPVRAGKRFPVAGTLSRFVFKQSFQLIHEDGLTFDFFRSIASDLHAKQEMCFLGAGPKGNQPVVVRDGGNPYRAFLYGEVEDDRYLLMVLLSDQELKLPEVKAPQPEGDKE